MKGFFTDKDGDLSMMRLMSWECIQAGILISFYGAYIQNMELLIYAGTLIAAGFTGKYAQVVRGK